MAGSSGLRNGLVSSSSCNVLGIVGMPCTSIHNVHLCCMLMCMTIARCGGRFFKLAVEV